MSAGRPSPRIGTASSMADLRESRDPSCRIRLKGSRSMLIGSREALAEMCFYRGRAGGVDRVDRVDRVGPRRCSSRSTQGGSSRHLGSREIVAPEGRQPCGTPHSPSPVALARRRQHPPGARAVAIRRSVGPLSRPARDRLLGETASSLPALRFIPPPPHLPISPPRNRSLSPPLRPAVRPSLCRRPIDAEPRLDESGLERLADASAPSPLLPLLEPSFAPPP